jgi:hypothetical protein
MSGLNTKYVPLSTIQEQFWDKLNDVPLANGVVSFYIDTARTIPKQIYVLSGSAPDYTYTSIGTSITLSSIGTFDYEGNNIVPYLYPYDTSGDIELYYITVYDSSSQFQFEVSGVPNISETTAAQTNGTTNFIPNSQFVLHNDLPNSGAISSTVTEIAPNGWYYIRSSNSATDFVTFPRFNSPIVNPTGNPRYATEIACTVIGSDTYKNLEIRFQDVNRFSDPTQKYTLFFNGINNGSGTVNITANLYKYFGSGGSTPTNTPINPADPAVFTTSWTNFCYSFTFGSNIGQIIGTNDDDYFSIQLLIPANAIFDISVTDFVLYAGEQTIENYPITVDPPYLINNVNTQIFTTSGTYYPSSGLVACEVEIVGGGGGGAGAPGSSTPYYCVGAGGGAAGGYTKAIFTASDIGDSQTITIGAAGAGGASGKHAGTAGGTTTFGSLLSATGGGAGPVTGDGIASIVINSAGVGGTGSGGDINLQGYNGGFAISTGINNNNASAMGGFGGNSYFGAGGASPISANGINAPTASYGAGGSGGGATSGNVSGGNGSAGIVVIKEYIYE